MKKVTNKSWLIALAGVVVVAFCAWEAYNLSQLLGSFLQSSRHESRCEAYRPGTKLEAKLIGTWKAGYPDQNDTLIIRDDGKYKQIVQVANPTANYESDWQPWRIEYREDGIPYLHLIGMRLCGLDPKKTCDRAGGIGYDSCRDAAVPMENEGILLILTEAGNRIGSAVQDIELAFPSGSEYSWTYYLQRP